MQFQSIPEMFFDACRRYDRKNAVLVPTPAGRRPYSHRFFRQRVEHFARGLLVLGIGVGDRVAIWSRSRFEWQIADLAIAAIGAVSVPLYVGVPFADSDYILQQTEVVAAVVADLATAQPLNADRGRYPWLKELIIMDEQPGDGRRTMLEVEQLGCREDNELLLTSLWQGRLPRDLLTIVYSGGTQGRPKGIQLSHGNVLANLAGCRGFMDLRSDDVCLSHLQPANIFERVVGLLLMLHHGVCIAYADGATSIAASLQQVRPTLLVSMPVVYEKLYLEMTRATAQAGFLKRNATRWALDIGKRAVAQLARGEALGGWLARKHSLAQRMVFEPLCERLGGRLRLLVCGGGSLTHDVADTLAALGLTLIDGYGLSEASPVLTINPPAKRRLGTVGVPIEGVTLRIADDGEIQARGANIMLGYFKDEAETARVLRDGWLRTGDIGNIDDQGYLHLTDSKSELLTLASGRCVPPLPLEAALRQSPLIEQVAVFGQDRPFISALIVPAWSVLDVWVPELKRASDPADDVDNAQVLQIIANVIEERCRHVVHTERIQAFRLLAKPLSVGAGELTPSLKIKRAVVAERHRDLIEQMYA